ncbi:MAG: tetratricopeptide repeat protein [Pirellulales bacterium]|nr:tetratricopeptide repeat protein [Pirellulales bacterium]
MHQRIPNLIEQALAALRNEEYARAVAIADQLAVDLPENPLVRSIRAQGLLYGDNPESALDEARKAVDLDPINAHSQILLAYAAWRCERPTLAQSAFEAAVRFSDREPFFLAEYAWFLANRRTPKAAENAARNALEANESSSTAWAALGLAQFRMHRQAEAETSLRRALALNPEDIYAQSAMVALLNEQGQGERAQELAGALAEHTGAEDLADSLREEAKRRKLAAMLLERNIDLEAPPPETIKRYWPAILSAAVFLGAVLYFLSPDRPLLALMSVLVPLLMIWLLGWIWR